MELQRIFSSETFEELKAQVKEGVGLERYHTGEFLFDKNKTFSLAGIYRPEGLADKLNCDKNNDIDNAILLYEAYDGLSPLIAYSEKFWAYLTHVEYFDYCKHRWPEIMKDTPTIPEGYKYPLKQSELEEVKRTNEYVGYILTHWFYNTGGRFRNALAGLWWPVFMTVEKNRDDKYALTKVLFSHADVRATAYASTLFRHKAAITGILEFYLENDDIRDSAWQWRNRYIFHYFNRLGGVTNLFYLNKKYFKEELDRNHDFLMTIKGESDVSNRRILEWK